MIKVTMNDMTMTEIDQAICDLQHEKINRLNAANKAIVKSHERYVGKCYKNYDFYYKIIGARSINADCVTALIFKSKPIFAFKYQSSRIEQPGNHFFGEYKDKIIEVGSVKVGYLKTFKEISLEEYNKAMNRLIKRLQTIQLF